MTGEGTRGGKAVGIGLVLVVLCAGVVWGVKHWHQQGAERDFNAQLAEGGTDEMRQALLSLDQEKLDSTEGREAIGITVERMRDMSFSEIMEVMRSQELTEEERRRLREVGREVFKASMNKNVDEYLSAPKEEREAILDRQIDEWMEFRAQMEVYHEEHKDDPDYQSEREQRHQRDRQEAKNRMEGGDPDQMKRMMYYWGQMRARTKARGIDMRRGSQGTGNDQSRRTRRQDKDD